MYIAKVKTKTKSGKVSHVCTLLRESYRVAGKVKTRTIANITNIGKKDIEAIEFALKNKNNLSDFQPIGKTYQFKEGLSFGAVYFLKEIAGRLGIEKALGKTKEAKFALWQVIARVIDRGSCLSAVRLAGYHAACDVLDIGKSFNEDDLYLNLAWLSDNQIKIEKKLFKDRYKDSKPDLFLYDVTSSYLEGKNNAFANWGYNRDKKKGKMQIVAGLLCDENGDPVSIELFEGNTVDFKTVASQIKKIGGEFDCRKVTFVGDRGMIKSEQIEELQQAGFNYITAITKPQIERFLSEGIFQMSLFDEDIKEIEHESVRYIFRRNPIRAKELGEIREKKLEAIEKLVSKKNEYLSSHPRAWVETAVKEVELKINKLKIAAWLRVKSEGRELQLFKDEEALNKESELDGCYVIKSDLEKEISKQTIHDRYKDLYKVEQAFRCCKTETLEMRPWYVQNEKSTRGRALIVMLAYLIIRQLKKMWSETNLTVLEGINQLSTLCAIEVITNGKVVCNRIPEPREKTVELLKYAKVKLPKIIPNKRIIVSSRKKLMRQS